MRYGSQVHRGRQGSGFCEHLPGAQLQGPAAHWVCGFRDKISSQPGLLENGASVMGGLPQGGAYFAYSRNLSIKNELNIQWTFNKLVANR